MADYTNEGTLSVDNLGGGDFPRATDDIVLSGGQGVLARGTVLGVITASGEAVVSTAGATDGSEDPKYILAETTDTSGGDVVAPIYKSGSFNEREITLGAGHTIASVRDALELRGIYLRSTVAQ